MGKPRIPNLLLALLWVPLGAAAADLPSASLDHGFRLLYNRSVLHHRKRVPSRLP